jgi:signal transduction histidine kinase
VFSVGDGFEGQVASVEAGADCTIHHMPKPILAELYEEAVKNGGSHNRRVESGSVGDGEDDFHLPGLHHPEDITSAICVRIVETENATYCVFLDSELTPVSATVKTLQVQFLWTALLLLFAALIFALILYRVIATPLTAITEKAGRLADGNYEADFEGHGYREVEELAETLNFAAREIRATDDLQRELIANISHDLRTPLTMIKGYSEIMRDLPSENNAENAQVIIDETTRLSELVSDLLDLSKLRSGTKKLEKEFFDLGVLTRETMLRYETLIRHDGYRIDDVIDDIQPGCRPGVIPKAVAHEGQPKGVEPKSKEPVADCHGGHPVARAVIHIGEESFHGGEFLSWKCLPLGEGGICEVRANDG